MYSTALRSLHKKVKCFGEAASCAAARVETLSPLLLQKMAQVYDNSPSDLSPNGGC